MILFYSRLFEDGGKSFRIAHSHVGKHLTIDRNICLAQGVDQPAVSSAVQSSGSVDAGNPQPAQVALAVAAIAVCEPQALKPGFVCSAVELGASAILPLGDF